MFRSESLDVALPPVHLAHRWLADRDSLQSPFAYMYIARDIMGIII